MWEFKNQQNVWIRLEDSIEQQLEIIFKQFFINLKYGIFDIRRINNKNTSQDLNNVKIISSIFNCPEDYAQKMLIENQGNLENTIDYMSSPSFIIEPQPQKKKITLISETYIDTKLQQTFSIPIQKQEKQQINELNQFEADIKKLMTICQCEENEAIDLILSADQNLEIAIAIFEEKKLITENQQNFARNNPATVIDTLYKIFSYPKEDIKSVLIEKDFNFDQSLEVLRQRLKRDVQEYGLADKDFANYLINSHEEIGMEIQIYKTLTSNQQNALKRIANESKQLSIAARPFLLKRVEQLGFTIAQLEETLKYVRDTAPIIIHVNLAKYLAGLLTSERYMNQFETNCSSGTFNHEKRKQWEDRLFYGAYKEATPRERVKYGVLNIVNDPNGVKCCSVYGKSFLLLKNVRLRTTFANSDTSGNVQLATCQYYQKVLSEYNDNELKAILECGTNQKRFSDSNIIKYYKEVQIHGDIFFNRDVQSLHYDPSELGVGEIKLKNQELLEQFRVKNKLEIIEIEI